MGRVFFQYLADHPEDFRIVNRFIYYRGGIRFITYMLLFDDRFQRSQVRDRDRIDPGCLCMQPFKLFPAEPSPFYILLQKALYKYRIRPLLQVGPKYAHDDINVRISTMHTQKYRYAG